MNPQRFTLDGSPALETHLAKTCEEVLRGVRQVVPQSKLQALLLGGGYGRGEGGVLRTDQGDYPYNDLEFYLCLQGSSWLNQRHYAGRLHALGHELSAPAGIEVEFKTISLEQLRRSPASMFYYDLVMGHRWLLGSEELLAGCAHHRQAEYIPLAEVTRLLMNRCTGLLFAQHKLQFEPFTAENGDFISRNQAKAQLAFGDAVLVTEGQYHWSCQTRHERLLQLRTDWPWLQKLQAYHAKGVAFKLHPQRAKLEQARLEQQQNELTAFALKLWLWLESRRLQQPFASAREYALSPADKCPDTPRWRNCLVNLSAFGASACWRHQVSHYPRERLFNTLPLLLWEPTAWKDPVLLQHLRSALNTQANNLSDLVQDYRSLWQRFN